MKIILVRHGETIWNRENRVQGLSDIELTERGKKQAEQLAQSLKDETIDVIVSSPLKRAYQTARAIQQFHDVNIEVDRDLLELDQGDFEGLTFRELREDHASFLEQWAIDPSSIDIPNGESLAGLQDRAWRVVERLLRKNKNAVIVSHNFTITTIVCRILDLRLSKMREACVDVASKTLVEIEGDAITICCFNDTSHLEED